MGAVGLAQPLAVEFRVLLEWFLEVRGLNEAQNADPAKSDSPKPGQSPDQETSGRSKLSVSKHSIRELNALKPKMGQETLALGPT